MSAPLCESIFAQNFSSAEQARGKPSRKRDFARLTIWLSNGSILAYAIAPFGMRERLRRVEKPARAVMEFGLPPRNKLGASLKVYYKKMALW